jgi:hypothetical protein
MHADNNVHSEITVIVRVKLDDITRLQCHVPSIYSINFSMNTEKKNLADFLT